MRQRITWAAAIALLAGLFVQGTTVGAFVVEQERQRIERTQPDLLGDVLNSGAITLPAPQSFAWAEAAAEHDMYIGGYCAADDAVLDREQAELTIEILDAILNKILHPGGLRSSHAIVEQGQNAESMIEILDAWKRWVNNIVWGV